MISCSYETRQDHVVKPTISILLLLIGQAHHNLWELWTILLDCETINLPFTMFLGAMNHDVFNVNHGVSEFTPPRSLRCATAPWHTNSAKRLPSGFNECSEKYDSVEPTCCFPNQFVEGTAMLPLNPQENKRRILALSGDDLLDMGFVGCPNLSSY